LVEHLSGYQRRDREVVDYQMYQLDEVGLCFRGPKVENLHEGEFFACLGAAQTFGCFAEKPFCTLLQDRLGLPALNLGYGGAGPSFYLKHAGLIDIINRSRFAIIQVMSGRSQSNALLDAGGLEYVTMRADGRRMSAENAYREILHGVERPRNSKSLAARIKRRIRRHFGAMRLKALVKETRANWVDSYSQLFRAIRVPTVLFWISRRDWDYPIDYSSVDGVFGDFPQLIDRQTMSLITPLASHYAQCVSSRGFPQQLISRFTGLPTSVRLCDDRPDFGDVTWTHNKYYPTPEMHVDAAESLAAVCAQYAETKDRRPLSLAMEA
jgi:hypothetical protein